MLERKEIQVMSKLVLEGVSKQYETGNYAVENFNLEVGGKEFIVFVGPSGCGKSTVLRMIAGLEEITEGDIFIDDEPVNKKMAAEGNIAMVFQNYALYPHMSVYDNIAYSLKIKGVPKKEIKEKVNQVAGILELEEVLDRKPGQLSGGQKQRVAMGRAMIRTPKLYLMDEPLSNLDAKLRTQMRKEIWELYEKTDATFVYVTHDQTEAMTLGTSIVVLNKGEIQQVAAPKQLYNYPDNIFVASFIGTPQMNLWEAEVVEEENVVMLLVEGMGEYMVPYKRAQCLRQNRYIGKKVIVGIRPEHLKIIEEDETSSFKGEEELKNQTGLKAISTVYEMTGANGYLYLEAGNQQITIETPGQKKYQEGKEYAFLPVGERIHFFDPETEKVIR